MRRIFWLWHGISARRRHVSSETIASPSSLPTPASQPAWRPLAAVFGSCLPATPWVATRSRSAWSSRPSSLAGLPRCRWRRPVRPFPEGGCCRRSFEPTGSSRARGFELLLKKAGLPAIRFHDLRHTCATLLLSRNVNPKIVSEMLGHATIAITLDTYSLVLPNMQKGAARALEETLR
jgi:integrase